jgi:predicted TIM-barrel fold metal-dependent hydrolase
MVRAIDVHVHPPDEAGQSLTSSEETQRYFRAAAPPKDAAEMADQYAELDLFGVLLNIDAETATGRAPTPNDYYADLVKRYPKRFIAFGESTRGRATSHCTRRAAARRSSA